MREPQRVAAKLPDAPEPGDQLGMGSTAELAELAGSDLMRRRSRLSHTTQTARPDS